MFWRSLLVSTVVGLALGGLGGRLLTHARARGWATGEWQQVVVLAWRSPYSVATAAGRQRLHRGLGGWLRVRRALRRGGRPEGIRKERPADLTENLGGLLGTLSFLVFGAVLLGPALEHLNWQIITYAVLSLTVVRMVPVALALAGTGMRLPTVGYIGWFGPRGLASVVFGLLLVEDHVPGVELLGRVVAVTIGLSVLLHGMSAPYFADRYGNWYDAARTASPDMREAQGAAESTVKQHIDPRRLR